MKPMICCAVLALPWVLACDAAGPGDPGEPGEVHAAAAAVDEVRTQPVAPAHVEPAAAEPGCDGECDGECDHAPSAPAKADIADADIAKAVDPTALAGIVLDDRPTRGGDDASVRIVVFSDFQCPYCARLLPSLNEALQTYGDDVSLTFKQMPLPFHPAAEPAARASLAAHAQGKFWALHDAMFEHPELVLAQDFDTLASDAGLDLDRFARDMADPETAATVTRDRDDAAALGIRGTPSLLIGDRLVVGARPLPELLAVIDAELAEG